MISQDQKEKLIAELAELEAQLADPKITGDRAALQRVAKEYSVKKELRESIEMYDALTNEINDLETTTDPDLHIMAADEIPRLRKKVEKLASEIDEAINPSDPMDSRDTIVEIRAGAGGDESALFAAELFRTYSRYADAHGWKTHLLNTNRIGIGGYKEVIFEVNGCGAFKDLKYESGVHRVQRVPDTEKSGRVHTSTVTVAVLPKVEELDVQIDPKDITIEASTAGGHGGQSVNTTYSAARITHLPTGIIVSCQDERSFQQNRLKALEVLRARVYQLEKEKRDLALRTERRSQIGTGERVEKIRTYNFPQDRVTDHRIEQNFHNLPAIMDGKLDEIIQALQQKNSQF
ncbi:peptide chain release factor 1 [Candidatus Uhrbacteria bacterium]|nr:peptide chain release factor 1 [Candidatus Uhrbacteria bacterium]